MKPNCYNRPAYKPSVLVPDGHVRKYNYTLHAFEVTPLLKEIPDNMTKHCHQHHPQTGEAVLHGWDCAGCVWKPEANND